MTPYVCECEGTQKGSGRHKWKDLNSTNSGIKMGKLVMANESARWWTRELRSLVVVTSLLFPLSGYGAFPVGHPTLRANVDVWNTVFLDLGTEQMDPGLAPVTFNHWSSCKRPATKTRDKVPGFIICKEGRKGEEGGGRRGGGRGRREKKGKRRKEEKKKEREERKNERVFKCIVCTAAPATNSCGYTLALFSGLHTHTLD